MCGVFFRPAPTREAAYNFAGFNYTIRTVYRSTNTRPEVYNSATREPSGPGL